MIEIYFPSNWEKTKITEWSRSQDYNWFVLAEQLYRGWDGKQFWFTIRWLVQLGG